MNNKDESIIYDRGSKKKSKFNIGILIFVLIFIFMFSIPFLFVIFSFKTVSSFGDGVYEEIVEDINDYVDYEDNYIEFDNSSYSIENVTGYYNSDLEIYYIEGYLKNVTTNDFDNINISYSVYDDKNILLGEAYAFVSGLKSGNTWKFKATYLEVDSSEVARYELASVNIY